MKKLLLISPVVFLPARSGVATHICGLLDYLEAEEYEVTYLLVDLFRFRVGGPQPLDEMRTRLGGRLHVFDVADQDPWWLRWLTWMFRVFASGGVGQWLMQARQRMSGGSAAPMGIDEWYPDRLEAVLSSLDGGWDTVLVTYVFLSRALCT